MAVAAEPQISIMETIIENPQLEAALESRQALKETAAEHNKAYREADEAAKAQIGELALDEDTAARIGRFIIKRREVEARAVAFETQPAVRFSIRTASNS